MRAYLLLAMMFTTFLFAETLTISLSSSKMPFSFIKKKKLVGFEVDLLKEIASRLDLEPLFVEDSPAQIRLGQAIAENVYMEAPLCLLMHKKRQTLEGKIATLGYGEELATKLGTVVDYGDNTVAALADLLEKKIAAIIVIKPAALYLQYASSDVVLIERAESIPWGFRVEDLSLRQKVQEVEAMLLREGVVEALYRKWFGWADKTLR